jgi:membrane protease YdiL (CAAX protease family)
VTGTSDAGEQAWTPRQLAYLSVAQTIVASLPIVIYLAVRTGMREGGLVRIGLIPARPLRDVGWGVAGFAASFVLVYAAGTLVTLACWVLGIPVPTIAHDMLTAMKELPWGLHRWMLVLGAVIGAPVTEEIIYRGLLQTTLQQISGWRMRWVVIFILSGLFTMMHMGAVPWQAMVSLFVLSICLGYLYERTGSLWPGIITHVLFNLTSTLLVIYDLVPDSAGN